VLGLGRTPSARLQGWLFDGHLRWHDHALIFLHSLHFAVPLGLLFAVWLAYRPLFVQGAVALLAASFAAAAVFLDRPDLSPASRRSYSQTLQHLARTIGEQPLATLDTAAVESTVQVAWGRCAPATWNRHVAIVRSFAAFCRRHGWLAEDVASGLDRRRVPADRTRAIPLAELERLWRREDASVREKAFWRLCYETAGRAAEVLGLNVVSAVGFFVAGVLGLWLLWAVMRSGRL